MNVFGVGLPEIAVIGALALLVFGPKRLPELGRTLGKTLKGFQAASTEFEKEIQKAMDEPDANSNLVTTQKIDAQNVDSNNQLAENSKTTRDL